MAIQRSEANAFRDMYQIERRKALHARRGFARDYARALENLEDWRRALEAQDQALTALADAVARAQRTP